MKLISIGKFVQKINYIENIQDYETWNAMSKYFDEIYLIVQSPDSKSHKQIINKLNIHWIPKYNKVIENIFFLAISLIKSIKLIKKNNIDVINVGEPISSGIMAVLLKRIVKKPLVTQIQGQLFNLPSDNYSWLKRILIKKIVYFVCKNSDRIRVVSKEIEETIIKAGIPKEKIFISPSRCNTNKFNKVKYEKIRIKLRKELFYENTDKVLIFIGRLIPAKDVSSILLAVRKLIEKKIKVKFLIVGSGEFEDELKKESERLLISDAVKFYGRVNFDKIPDFLAAGDIFVSPSLDEGMPRAVLEAMSMELPVIVTPVGGNLEIIKNNVNGIIVDIKNPKQIVEAVEKLSQDNLLRNKLSTNARKTVLENYEFDKCIKSFSDIHFGI